ncbi:hypothetical protein ACF3M2_14000 [Tissierella carlieri]|uniref:hypothetical protein n=1 Tax=Tissierella carlieri TaxID=689904 RepID=UPI00386DBB6B
MKKKILYYAIFFLILALFTFYYEQYRIPKVVGDVQDIKKENILCVTEPIPRNTIINDEILSKHIKAIQVPTEYVFNNPITAKELIGKKAGFDIPNGTYLTKEYFIEEEEGYKDGEQSYSFPIKSSNAMIGKVQPNDYVAVWVRYPGSNSKDALDKNDSEVVIPYIKLEDLVDEAGTSITNGATTIDHAVVKANRDIVQDIEIARKYELFFTKYGENEECLPAKTFNREEHLYTSKPFKNYIEKEEYFKSLEEVKEDKSLDSVETKEDENIPETTENNQGGV